MGEGSPIDVDVSITFSEFLKLSYVFAVRQTGIWLAIILVSFLFIYFISGNVWPLYALGALAALTVWLAVMIFINARKVFNNSPVMKERIRYSFTQNGIDAAGDSFTTAVGWNLVIKASEFAGFFMLYTSPGTAFHLPQRAFHDQKQQDEFRSLLREQLGNKAKLKK